MSYYTLLSTLGEKIFNRILLDTEHGGKFLLSIIDPDTFEVLKEETGNGDSRQVERALKSTGESSYIPNDYIAISIALLQVSLVYSSKISEVSNAFYPKMKAYYIHLRDDSDVQRYFEDFQEPLWERVKQVFERKGRELLMPKPKTGPGRYVQFPTSQQLIRWNELIEYADKFIRVKLEPYQILSFDDFCSRIHINYDYQFSSEENEAIRKIIFSFYNRWDGRKTDEIKTQRFKTQGSGFKGIIHNNVKPEITLKLAYEEIRIYKDGHEIPEENLKEYVNKLVIPFIFDNDYQDWIYTRKILQAADKLLVLVNKSSGIYAARFDKMKHDYLRMKYFDVYIFEECNSEVADFVDFVFNKKEIYTIIGGIKSRGDNNFSSNVLGCWYDFALPTIKIKLPSSTRVFIDSKEIIVDKNGIDLSNIALKENNVKYHLEPGEHSFKCTDISPAYFFIEEGRANINNTINHGWIISSNNLRPVKQNENPDMVGLKIIGTNQFNPNAQLRPFLVRNEYLQNRLLERLLDKKTAKIELRGKYGS